MTIILSPGGKPWSDFRRGILMSVRGAPMHVVDYHAQQAAIEFCRDSHCLRSETITLATTDGTDRYTLNPPAEVQIHKLHAAWIDGVEATVLDKEDFQASDPLATASSVFSVCLTTSTTLRTAPAASAGVVITGVLSYVPTEDAAVLDIELFRRWHKEIEAKAKADLLMMPNTPWRDLSNIAYYMDLYNDGVTTASNEAGAVTASPLRVKGW